MCVPFGMYGVSPAVEVFDFLLEAEPLPQPLGGAGGQ
jgi:hypothetical protein